MHRDIPILSLGEIVIVKISSNCIRVHIGIFHIRDVMYSFDLVGSWMGEAQSQNQDRGNE